MRKSLPRIQPGLVSSVKKYLPAFILIVLAFVADGLGQNQNHLRLEKGKFITGDDSVWSKPGFDDREWKDASLGEVWQRQGFPDYHGYAWYRIHVTLPSSLRESGVWKDSLRIFLAHVNDVDDTFLNGIRIGKIGAFPEDAGGYVSKWPSVREYHVSADNRAIRWDQENIIAVRVYDGGGTGGIFMGNPYIDMLEKIDGVSYDNSGDLTGETIQILPDDKVAKKIRVRNGFNTTVEGTISYAVMDVAAGKKLNSRNASLILGPLAARNIRILAPHRAGIAIVITYTEKSTGLKKEYNEVVPYLLTPPVSQKPRINGASVFGFKPGSTFFYKIPATGEMPIEFKVKNLPSGLTLNAATGLITGRLSKPGEYTMTFVAKNNLGKDERKFTVKAGSLLALTPPMGWNSWNCWGLSVSDEKVKSSARAMFERGLANHGWMYVNIDDGWEAPQRTVEGTIAPNEKFPDMKGLGDFLHEQGLRFGIYSSPGPRTCGGYLGSYKHEQQDADTYASWGIDYLKYDLCSYRDLISKANTLEEHQKPYLIMRDALKKQSRDIVYSLCQYGIRSVQKWGPEVSGNLWRTTGDITDTWRSLYRIGFSQDSLAAYAKPGGWNDPDMLIVGMVGWGESLHPTNLTADEQYTHMTLWSLLSAPLLIGCDLSKLDAFTMNLLTNDEVIAIDQDPLGKSGRRVYDQDSVQVWVKDLMDGTKAVGIFNIRNEFRNVTVKWSDIGIAGPVAVRDVWRQKDLGQKSDYQITVPSHGVNLIRISGLKR